MKKYLIHTQDVDGETKDVYDDQAKAVARFEEMYGYPIQNAIEEKYWLDDTPPTIETVRYVDAVSNFGTVVAYEVLEGSEQPVTYTPSEGIINAVIDQIQVDIADKDLTALAGLLEFVPEEQLVNYLSQ
jgi:hypothetical protein